MKIFKKITYSQKIRWQINEMKSLIFLMFIYMIIIGKLGLGDSRVMTPLANLFSGVFIFGGIIWLIVKIQKSKKLIKDRALLQGHLVEKIR